MTESQPLVKCSGLRKQYPGTDHPALVDLDLTVGHGEFFSILGPSGSGKTTILKLIAGFERPDQGRILIDDLDVTDKPAHQRPVNTVFQSYALFPHLSALQNVLYPLKMLKTPRSEAKRRATEALELVSMSAFADRAPHQLSGGQRQRVALARAIVSRPKLVLLDEPLGALDLQMRHQMQVVLKQLQQDLALTFVYVTHDQGEALAMSDRIAVMRNGIVEEIGTSREIYNQPDTIFGAEFIGRSNILKGPVTRNHDRMELVLGDLLIPCPGASEGGSAVAAIRFEHVHVSPSGTPCPGDIHTTGSITSLIYQGDRTEVGVDVGGASVVSSASSSATRQLSRGDRINVGIDSNQVKVFND